MPANRQNLKTVSPQIANLLQQVRSRIRKLIIGEGIAITIAAMLIAFWTAFLIDYGPVRFGYPETPIWLRTILLTLTGLAAAYCLWRVIGRRLFVRLRDSSMAMLVEKEYRQFNDSLLTTVNQANADLANEAVPDLGFNPAMLDTTRAKAESLVKRVNVQHIVNSRSFHRTSWLAAALIGSAVVFAIAEPGMASLAFDRLCLLRNDKWPRQSDIELVGIAVQREQSNPAIAENIGLRQPIGNVLTIAKGSSLAISVTARSTSNDQTKRTLNIPTTCWLNYQTQQGNRGSQPFKRIGSPRDGLQTYTLATAPLENIIDDLTVDISGGDDRLETLQIRVVDPPIATRTDLHVSFPQYMVDEQSNSFTDRTERWTGQISLPVGTEVDVEVHSKQELSKVYFSQVAPADDGNAPELTSFDATGNSFRFSLPKIEQTSAFQFYLCDQHGIVSEQPHVIAIDSIQDQAPDIKEQLVGIGTAVTPNVQLPISAEVSDDYGINEMWIELEIGDSAPFREALPTADRRLKTKLNSAIDFRQRIKEFGESYRLPTEGANKLVVTVAASDHCDLGGEQNIGSGNRYELDIVTPDELLRILEQLEVGQRRRLEQIVKEIIDLKSYLNRSKSRSGKRTTLDREPGDEGTAADAADEAPDRTELRRLFAQRSILQSDKSKQEVAGCAAAFENLRLQLINNRVTADARQDRFENQVIAPLQQTVDVSFAQLRESLTTLEQSLTEIEEVSSKSKRPDPTMLAKLNQTADAQASTALEHSETVLNELRGVLDLLIKHETQNELLDIVRQMIQKQKDLIQRTKKQRQKKAFEGLLD
jgi:hypothetical protein